MKPAPFYRISALLGLACTSLTAATLDEIRLGTEASEKAHNTRIELGSVAKDSLGQTARILQPQTPVSWAGGRLSFTMKVDAGRPNYITGKFSGSEVNTNRLMLYINGKQLGWRHLGETDPLDFGTHEQAYPGRYYFSTSPIPEELTRGKSEVTVEIRTTGLLWGYGTNFKMYQKDMVKPSRMIFGLYTHTDGFFSPGATETLGKAPAPGSKDALPGEEVLLVIKDRVNSELEHLLSPSCTPGQMQMQLLAKAYEVSWSKAYKNPQTTTQLLRGLDHLYREFLKNPKLAQEDPATWNPDWFGLGICGQILTLRQAELRPFLDQAPQGLETPGLTRRSAYAEMLKATRDWHRLHRRLYTNQTMLNDLNGIYHPNRGLAVVSPSEALPEPEALRYLYEAVGLQPWTDSDKGGALWKVGPNYWQLTDKGLTKELGYVGSYGEVIDLVCDIYEATRPSAEQPGDEKIRGQLVKIALARSYFRHPSVDANGIPTMQLEQIVGWRDAHYPGYTTYAQRSSRDASALQAAVITRDPRLLGFARQMLSENRFFSAELEAMADKAQPLRTTIGRLATPDQYSFLKALPDQGPRMPMSPGQADFVWSDEEDGVLALRHGDSILYASLYWRARYGVNNLARIHYLTPACDRIAVVRQHIAFTPNGDWYTRPDQSNMAFGNGGVRYPGENPSAHAGEKLPIAKIPEGLDFRPGKESTYAGRGEFYTLRYGKYLIGMNASRSKTFHLTVPPDMEHAHRFTAPSENLVAGSTLEVPAMSTTVIVLEP